MKTVLITGGAGFIGSHLTERVLNRGDRAIVVDDQSTGSFANLAECRDHERLEVLEGSVANPALVEQLVARADEIYHLAAAVGVSLIAGAPIHTIETNIYPTQLILAEARKAIAAGRAIPMFLASTSEVYGKNPKESWTEEDDLVFGSTTCARWSYGASKAIDEFLALAHCREHGLPIVIGRLFNVVGPRQTGRYGMVLPRFVDAVLAGRGPMVHDDGEQVRCFAHVSDVVGAILQLVQTPAAHGRVFNIGSDQPTTIRRLAERVLAAVGSDLPLVHQSYAEAYSRDFEDIRRRVPDLSRLRSTIDFRLRYDLDAIIADLVRWKREQLAAL